jgi:predicted ATPase
MIGHRLMGCSLLSEGSIAESRIHFDQAMALYDSAHREQGVGVTFVDIPVTVLGFRTLSLWMLGYPDAAQADVDSVLDRARASGQAATLMFALNTAQLKWAFGREHARIITSAQELVTLAEEKSAPLWKGYGMMNLGVGLALSGQAAAGVEALTRGLADYRATGATLVTPFYLAHLAKAYAALARLADAQRALEEARSAVQSMMEAWCAAEIEVIAGTITLAEPQPDRGEAEQCFHRALAFARAANTKSWELRAAMSLAGLWRDQGRVNEARDLLEPVYGWFTEGFGTPDLREAKALLEMLSGATVASARS